MNTLRPHGGKIVLSLFIIIALMMPVFSYAKDSDEQPARYVRGRICDLDYPGSRLTIQWFYTTSKMSEDKMVFHITDKTSVITDRRKIFKAFRKAGIVDLIIGDHVIIKYYVNKKNGNLEAANIRVLEQDRPIAP